MFGSHTQDDPAFQVQVFPPKQDLVGCHHPPPENHPARRHSFRRNNESTCTTALPAHLEAPKPLSKNSYRERKGVDITDHNTNAHLFSIICSSVFGLDVMTLTSWQRPPFINSPTWRRSRSQDCVGASQHLDAPGNPLGPLLLPATVNLRCGWFHFSAGRKGNERIR